MPDPFDRRYQVFVSSTYEDLIEERKRVYEALLETYCIPVGMELFPAAPEDKWKMICRLIDDCDYFVIIVAGKYGTAAPDGVSWTEKEFDYAREVGRKPIGFFFHDLGQLLGSKLEDTDVRKKQLNAFTRKVRQGSCKPWVDGVGLASAVKSAIINAVRTDPKPGWVRADSVADESEIERLRSKSRGTTTSSALGEELVDVPMVGIAPVPPLSPDDPLPNLVADLEATFPMSLTIAFGAISSGLDKPKPTRSLRWAFHEATAASRQRIEEKFATGGRPPIKWNIPDEFFHRLLATFEGKGLIRQVPPPKSKRESYAWNPRTTRQWYWQLTSRGRVERARSASLI